MFSQTNVSTFNYTAWGVGNVSMMDVYLKNKHRKEDMIVRYVRRPGGQNHKLSTELHVSFIRNMVFSNSLTTVKKTM